MSEQMDFAPEHTKRKGQSRRIKSKPRSEVNMYIWQDLPSQAIIFVVGQWMSGLLLVTSKSFHVS